MPRPTAPSSPSGRSLIWLPCQRIRAWSATPGPALSTNGPRMFRTLARERLLGGKQNDLAATS